MSETFTVIVGARELHDALRHRTGSGGEVLIFGDDEPLKAFETIAARHPHIVALERLFAVTPRGAALINRIKADPALSSAEIRIVTHDGTYVRVSPRRTPTAHAAPIAPAAIDTSTAVDVTAADEAIEPAEEAAPAASSDYAITRRARRFRMSDGTEAQVDGAPANVIDLSTIGAQILSPAPLKPAQLVRVVLTDEIGAVRFSGSVAWASYEIPKGVSRYRAGVEFNGAEALALEAFCKRHRT